MGVHFLLCFMIYIKCQNWEDKDFCPILFMAVFPTPRIVPST